jgi:ABC-2 type transport system ATP-binding protein
MDYLLKVDNLTKKYGRKKALDGFTLNIESGKIVGLLGPNGSGKTTFIKVAAALLNANKGEILIDGKKPGVESKAIVSYLPDRDFLYKWMKVKDAVSFFKDFFKDFDEKKAYEMIDFMKLDPEQRVTSLSKGMGERLNLSLILSRNAKLYLLDEPLAAVDPATRDKLINAIIQNFREDSSIIISTHLVNDVERLFDEAAFISEGKIILHENVEKLKEESGNSLEDVFKEMFA